MVETGRLEGADAPNRSAYDAMIARRQASLLRELENEMDVAGAGPVDFSALATAKVERVGVR